MEIPDSVTKVCKEIGLSAKDSCWELPQRKGTWIMKHKSLERIAAHKGVKFDIPTIIESDAEKKICIIMVSGTLGEASEWSIGEATAYNNKNAYPFAMAEKRAKDRVILKLVGLHGDVYSDIEADDFKQGAVKEKSVGVSDEVQTPPAVSAVDEWQGVQIHFGKNAGVRLGDLKPNQLEWYQTKWSLGDNPSDDDKVLRLALDKSMKVGGTQDGFEFGK